MILQTLLLSYVFYSLFWPLFLIFVIILRTILLQTNFAANFVITLPDHSMFQKKFCYHSDPNGSIAK